MRAQDWFARLVLPVVVALPPLTARATAEMQPLAAPAQTAESDVTPVAESITPAGASPFDLPRSAVRSASVDPSKSAATSESMAMPAHDTGFGVALSADQLDRQRGGNIQVATSTIDGTVANNVASRVVTGSNSIADGSFANSSGLPTVIQNTGANVLIQNSTVLNVHFGQ
jgi:hypothetical protein